MGFSRETRMKTVKKGISPKSDVYILQAFLKASGYAIETDGDFGAGTTAALQAFQRDNGLIVDGVAGPKTWSVLFAKHPDLLNRSSAKWLSEANIVDFGSARQLEVPVVRAVYAVEAGGTGFVGELPKILFEGHVFWDELGKVGLDPRRLQVGNEDILFPRWDRKSYRGGLAEHERLARAQRIHEEAALKSASWGLFQIMGNNAQWLGYRSVQDFVDRMRKNEAEHLDAFGAFIERKKLDGKPLVEHLRARDWESFAKGYNGAGYKVNGYHTKLKKAYEGFAGRAAH